MALAARCILIIVFAWSAGGKLLWPQEFRALLTATGMIPDALLSPVACGLPWVELAIVALLIIDRARTAALTIVLFLATVFAGMHGYLLVVGDAVPCGCAGVRVSFTGWPMHMAFLGVSLAMLSSALVLIFRAPATPRAVSKAAV